MQASQQAFEKAAKTLKQTYPGLSPEAIVTFLYVAAEDEGIALFKLSAEVGLDEAAIKPHLLQLAVSPGGGLIQIMRPTEDQLVVLTPQGRATAAAIEAAVRA